MGGAEVSIRGQKASIIGIPDVNVTDRAARILGQLTDGINVIDPRQIRNLVFATDKVDVSGSSITVSGGSITITNAPSNPIIDYNTTLGLGAGSSGTHNYIATGNFRLSNIEVSASGALKIEVKSGNIGSETTKLVAFTTETGLTAQLRFHELLILTIGQRLQVTMTNRELQSMDTYSTIMGFNT